MIFLIAFLCLILIISMMLILMLRAFKNIHQPHEFTPEKFDIAFDEITIRTKNHRQLYAWWIPAQTECTDTPPTLILVHGWNRNVQRMMPYIKQLQPMGYNLLAFDARCHGSSDSDGHSTMLKFAEDISAAIDFLKHQPCSDPERIGVIGLSIGGAGSIYAASLDKRIKSVISVGAFAHPMDVMKPEFEKRHIPFFPVAWLFMKYVEFRIGATFDTIAPANNIHKSDASIILIHGMNDTVVPVEKAEQLKNVGNSEKVKLWTIPGKGHSDCHEHPEFWIKLEEFLRKSLIIDAL